MAIGFKITEDVGVGDDYPLLVLAGPCVIESPEICLEIGAAMKEICGRLGLGICFQGVI
jgi:2-dehydro-3-deoxyphosphooctonate aldolase (KDO 8-P synthase)